MHQDVSAWARSHACGHPSFHANPTSHVARNTAEGEWYMIQQPMLKDGSGGPWHLKKARHGLKQADSAWRTALAAQNGHRT